MFRAKGLIVHWPDVPEGESAAMQFGHEVGNQALAMRVAFNKNPAKTYARVIKIVNGARRVWVVRVTTMMDFKNKRTGKITTEIIKTVIKPPKACYLDQLTDHIAQAQIDDMSDKTKTISGRTIECFCRS